MSSLISGIQSALVTLLKNAKTATPTNAPKVIEAYGGQFENPKKLVRNMPAIYVNSSNQFSITNADIEGALLDGVFNTDIILFSKNNLNQEKTYGDMAVLIDWVIDALRGETVTVEGVPIPVAEDIQGEYFPALDCVVLTLNLGATDDA